MTNSVPNTNLVDDIVVALQSVTGTGPTALHEPSFEGNEWIYLKECLDSTYVSSVGKYVNRFEDELAEYTGAKHAISVVNGTAALHIALKLAGVKASDEVLIPALTFVATANAVKYCNATPHLVDSEENTLGIDTNKLLEYLKHNTFQKSEQCINKNTGNVIRALVPMHTFGHPSNIEDLLLISREFNIVLVEDAAESLGSFYKEKHTGTFGLLGTLSFNGNKTITTGGGGAILTDDYDLARRAKHLTTTAKMAHAWEFRHDEVGYNYRMPNINAALGCAQLEQLKEKLEAKRNLHNRYKKALLKVKGVKLFSEPENCRSNYWLQTILLDVSKSENRDAILEKTNRLGIMTRPAWVLMNELNQFKNSPSSDLSQSHSLSNRIINIPSSPSIGFGL